MDDFKLPLPAAKVKPIATKPSEVEEDVVSGSKEVKLNPPDTTPSPSIPYKVPKWSETPPEEHDYHFEVLKSGKIIDEVKNLQYKPFWVFGRLPANDIEMAHPTISRFHAVLQYRPKIVEEIDDDEDSKQSEQKKQIEEGWYIFDLGSTHGTFVNKQRVPPKTYIRVKVGHMLRLGASTRNFILQGPQFDEEPESELTVTEIKELRKQQEEAKRKEAEMQEQQRERDGISWGMGDDADEETDLSVNPYATTNNEELFLDDPKKTLRGFFEREGLNLEYKCDEMSVGSFVCRVELPVDDSNGRPIVAEVCHKGKKKDCVLQCALEACRILDRQGILRQSHHEPLKRKVQTADSDDDDDFLDRTGDVQRKKLRKATTTESAALTYEDLLIQETDILKNLASVEESISKYQEVSKKIKEAQQRQEEDLESFMDNLSEDAATFDKNEIRRLRMEQQRIKTEHLKVQKLIKITRPVNIPTVIPVAIQDVGKKQLALPLFGKRNKSRFTAVTKTVVKPKEEVTTQCKSDEEEMDDEEHVEKPKLPEEVQPKEDESVKESLEIESTVNKEDSPTKLYGPIVLPTDDDIKNINTISNLEDKETKQSSLPVISPPTEIIMETEEPQNPPAIEEEKVTHKVKDHKVQESSNSSNTQESDHSKKRRHRQRIRNKREHVDIDDLDEHENTEKYSGWLPPENQSGDGHTSLNEKFGY